MTSTEVEEQDGLLGTAELEAAAAAARARCSRLQRQIEELRRGLVAAEAEARLLDQLLALRRRQGRPLMEEDSQYARGEVQSFFGRDELLESGASGGSRRWPVTNAAVEVLEESGQPTHISMLMEALGHRGVSIPGSGTQANLISYLRRDSRIARPSRGMYALRDRGFEDAVVVNRHKARKRQPKGGSRK